ncbi:calmodulin-binding protein 60 B-like isoform X2 [Phalaenopsis equestris]|uniref:calmodulin-binding protein 60 B-like isoform X2 n=1 Tax=Phalaenopsis equestris TaxID=78828 RepID=UPI0009E58BC9|nr:calmodulin-binding protein 60 B-like isoform X2 [Phalaenopsis equestris]
MQRSTRNLERSTTMTREKRALDTGDGDERGGPEAKRQKVPALASVIVEALKVDSLQKLCSSLEPVLRRVVSEEVERALAKLGPARLGARSSPKRLEGPDGRSLQLQFRSRLSLPIFTGGKVEGEQGAAIHVVLIDANNNHVVTYGPESSAKFDILVLEGDFNNEDDEDWTEEEFESHVVKEREGKRPLLTGDLQVSLKEGVGTLGELTFTDNSSWIRSRKFRLGLKVAPGFCDGIRIREGKTEAFTVKDHRGELYKKHYPPALKDEVWRLEKIGKDGAFHKKLNKAGISSVEDFLRLLIRDPQRLRNILGSGMSNKMWDVLVEHAKTCVLSGKYYIYYSDETRNIGAIFNNIYEFTGLIASGQYFSAESLNESQKIFADTLVKKAYDNWLNVIEYDGKALLSFKHNNKASRSETSTASSCNPSNYTQQLQQVAHQQLPAPVSVEQPSIDTSVSVGGISATRYSHQTQQINSNVHIPYDDTSFAPQTQFNNSSSHQPLLTRSSNTGLALAPPLQQPSLGYQPLQTVNANSYEDWSRPRDNRGVEDFFSEDEIRMRSHEILENDDMQHLLRVFNMGGAAGANLPEDGFGFSSYMPSPFPSYNFDDDRNRSSGKAVVGWLKIKAAMRWGIFIRKKAAERRAHLVELEED